MGKGLLMTENRDILFAEETIDLRFFLITLWRKKWIIALAMVLCGLAAFLVSSYLVSERYEAEAFITITEPTLITELETSIQANLAMFETSGLPGLAESTALKDLTFSVMGIMAYDEQSAYDFSASMQGNGQLKLGVSGVDPTLTAEAANTWAGVMKERLNEIYGIGEETITSLEGEVTQAEDNWSEAQLALEAYLSESRLNSADLQLAAARSILMVSLQEIDHNQLLLADIQALLHQIEEFDQSEALTTGTALSLITLQQRAAASQGDPLLQIQIEQSMKTDLSGPEAKLVLLELEKALLDQNQLLEEEVSDLEEEIIELALVLEKEQYRIAQLTEDRDLSRHVYTALSSQLEETRITQAQEESWPMISAPAIVPREPVGPNVFLYTVLASLLALFACLMLFLFIDWWNLE